MGRNCKEENEANSDTRILRALDNGLLHHDMRFMKLPNLESPKSTSSQSTYQPINAHMFTDINDNSSINQLGGGGAGAAAAAADPNIVYNIESSLNDWAALDRLVASQLNGQSEITSKQLTTTCLHDDPTTVAFCSPMPPDMSRVYPFGPFSFGGLEDDYYELKHITPRDGEETMQLDSPYQQLTVELSTNSGRNVVGAEQRNSTSYLPVLEACQNVGEIVQPDSSYHKAMTEVDATNSGMNVVSAEQRDSSYQKNMAEVDATSNEKKFASADQSDIADIPLEKRGPAEGSDREGEITREVLEELFGMDIENAARILGVSRSTFKRKCREHGIKRWPFPKRNKVTRSPSQLESIRGANKQTGESSRRDCLPCDKAPKQATTSIASTMPHASAKQNESYVAIKATCGDDIIKFQLSFSSGMVELEEEVAKRLKLKAGSFKIKYADEDDDSILVSCDEALQDCINSWRSSDRASIKMLVLPIIN